MKDLLGVQLDWAKLQIALQELIADPASNLTAAVLILALVSILLLIIIVVVLFLLPGGDDDEDEYEDDDVPAGLDSTEQAADIVEAPPVDEPVIQDEPIKPGFGERHPRAARVIAVSGAVLIPVLIVAAVVSGYVVSSSDDYCVRCHAVDTSKADDLAGNTGARGSGQYLSGPHKRVSCVRCHEQALPYGAVDNVAMRLRDVAAWAAGAREPGHATVDADRCLSCHEDRLGAVIVDKRTGTKMSHAEPLAAGMVCDDCHKGAGHSSSADGPGMATCLRCHDGKTASSTCKECHVGDVSKATVVKRSFMAQELVGEIDCSGCHSQRKCDACHGLRMPHSKTFMAYDHARYAGFSKKDMCYRCHAEGDCGRCHNTTPRRLGWWGHGNGDIWRTQHATITPPGVQAGCGCHSESPYARAGNFCKACH